MHSRNRQPTSDHSYKYKRPVRIAGQESGPNASRAVTEIPLLSMASNSGCELWWFAAPPPSRLPLHRTRSPVSRWMGTHSGSQIKQLSPLHRSTPSPNFPQTRKWAGSGRGRGGVLRDSARVVNRAIRSGVEQFSWKSRNQSGDN